MSARCWFATYLIKNIFYFPPLYTDGCLFYTLQSPASTHGSGVAHSSELILQTPKLQDSCWVCLPPTRAGAKSNCCTTGQFFFFWKVKLVIKVGYIQLSICIFSFLQALCFLFSQILIIIYYQSLPSRTKMRWGCISAFSSIQWITCCTIWHWKGKYVYN